MRTSRIWHHYSSLRLLCSALPLLYSLYLSPWTRPRPYICQFTTGLPRPIRRQQGTGAQSISQSACTEELARESRPIIALARTARMPTNQSAERNPRAKHQPIRGLLGTRANANQSERLQEPRECRPIRALAGTPAKVSQSECLLIIVYAAPSNRVHRTSASVLRKHLTKSSKLICTLTFDIKWRNVFRHTIQLGPRTLRDV